MGMLTVTAPGTTPGHQQVVPAQVYRRGMARPVCGCEGSLDDRGVPGWNATTAARWNHLRTLIRRQYPGVEFIKGTEVQQRGALHIHVILWSPQPVSVLTLQRLALQAGFGCSVDWAPAVPGSRRAAYYIAKYVTKDAEPSSVPWDEDLVDERTGEVTRCTRAHFRPWTASRQWGLTMGEVRRLARASAAAAAAARLEDEDDQDGTNTDRWRSGGGGLPPPDR